MPDVSVVCSIQNSYPVKSLVVIPAEAVCPARASNSPFESLGVSSGAGTDREPN